MGRNEMLSDSKTLIEAEKAYLDNDGSFKALVVSLLSSIHFYTDDSHTYFMTYKRRQFLKDLHWVVVLWYAISPLPSCSRGR